MVHFPPPYPVKVPTCCMQMTNIGYFITVTICLQHVFDMLTAIVAQAIMLLSMQGWEKGLGQGTKCGLGEVGFRGRCSWGRWGYSPWHSRCCLLLKGLSARIHSD